MKAFIDWLSSITGGVAIGLVVLVVIVVAAWNMHRPNGGNL
jgi:hypothetical protein